MKASVYIESSVISYVSSRPSRDLIVAAHQQITHEWWEHSLPQLKPFISQFVINEVSAGDAVAAAKRVLRIKDYPLLAMTPEIAKLADTYFAAINIPHKARTDAFHLAIATWYGLDYLVSWNCIHIASARVRSVVEQLNTALNLATPVICTPEELMEV